MTDLALKLDPFGGRALRGVADGQGRSLEEVVADALANLESQAERDRVVARPPRFLAHRSKARLTIPVAAPDSHLDRLRGEARRRRVPVERLVEHALLLYLADESERVEL
jgi:hypothetical protein